MEKESLISKMSSMKILFISGAPKTGKTTAIGKLRDFLVSKGYTSKISIPYSNGDFAELFEKNDKTVLLHSATDNVNYINILVNNINTYQPDTLVTSSRDFTDGAREYLCQSLGIFNVVNLSNANSRVEFPLAKITRRNNFSSVLTWYQDNINDRIENILSNNPFNV